MKLRYGKSSIDLEIPKENLLGVVKPIQQSIKPISELLKESVMDPIGAPNLHNLLRKNKPTDIVIIVSDITRSISNYSEMLKFLVSEIVDAGIDERNIEFMIALGTHKKHTPEENKILYGDLISDFKFSFHDCYTNYVSLGKTSTNLEVQVNKRVRDADLVIVTGRINFHYLAGFSGGRKAILPGISSYATIKGNHSKLKRDGVIFGNLHGNIIAQEMDEASRLFGVDYLLNVIETTDNDTDRIFWGHPEFAFLEGIKCFISKRSAQIFEKADCAIISAGGYPKDRTFYLSHKSLNSAVRAVKKGGTIVLIAQCSEGVGDDKFQQYMQEYSLDELIDYPEERIEIGGHRAFQTAKILKDYKIYVLSDLESEILTQMHFSHIKNINECISQIKKIYGKKFKAYVLPNGKSMLPVMEKDRTYEVIKKHKGGHDYVNAEVKKTY